MQVTPSNALFAALSAQIQSLQQTQPQHSRQAVRQTASQTDADKPSQGSATVLDGNGQVDSSGVTPNLNLREAPSGSRHSGQSYVEPGSLIDITI